MDEKPLHCMAEFPAMVAMIHKLCTIQKCPIFDLELPNLMNSSIESSLSTEELVGRNAIIKAIAVSPETCFDKVLSATMDYLIHKIVQTRPAILNRPNGRRPRVMFFSPHPDDDVISAGGILDHVAQHGAEVHCIYMVNGSVAVWDGAAERHLDFMERMMAEYMVEPDGKVDRIVRSLSAALKGQEAQDQETDDEAANDDMGRIKKIIRESEAVAAVKTLGIPRENVHFLDLPFYKTGKVKKNSVARVDIDRTAALISRVRPDHVFVAADLADPHGTHRKCYEILKAALAQHTDQLSDMWTTNTSLRPCSCDTCVTHRSEVQTTPAPIPTHVTSPRIAQIPDLEARFAAVAPLHFLNAPHRFGRGRGHLDPLGRPAVWMYRGAWEEWGLLEADVILPLTKHSMTRKLDAIFRHESQKDRAMFPGDDEREFWQRAVDRNRANAAAMYEIGLPYYHAAESFKVCWPEDMPDPR